MPYATQDIFVLDLDTLIWEKLEPSGDPMVPCNMHSAELYKDKIYVFRGGDGNKYLNDLHSLDVERRRWTREITLGQPPSPRANHASAMYSHFLYLFGGWNGI